MKKCAVFSCLGLGDGLLTLVLSHNLRQNGSEVTTFHPFLTEMQSWFPGLPIAPFPAPEKLEELLARYDRFFIFFERTDRMRQIVRLCEEKYPDQTFILNPIATTKRDYPYWEHGRFDGSKPIVENLYTFCKERLMLSQTTRENGIAIPPHMIPKRHPKRVIIHPTSSRPGKNWPKGKFLSLAKKLEQLEFEPFFVMSKSEADEWGEGGVHAFSTFMELAQWVGEAGFMIGNDSGVGHLASCLGLPTLTIASRGDPIRFWRPSWSPGLTVSPARYIPNIKWMRLRDKHWKRWISVENVFSNFLQLTEQKQFS